MVAAVAIFAAASCNKELPQGNELPVGETVVYTASVDGADTKAVLNEETKKSEWVAGDAITVHDGNKGWTFTADKAGQHTDFSNSEGFGEYRPVLAVYPTAEAHNNPSVSYTANVAAKTLKAYIPTWQQAQTGTYHSASALAVAYSEGNSFAFKNAHALLKFTVNADNVTHVVFHGNKEEAITGNVYVTLGDEAVESVECLNTEFPSGEDENQTVETKKGTWVECYAYHDDHNKYFVNGKTYYIAVAPQVFESGVTVKVRIDEGEEIVAKTTNKKVETKINTILNLGEIEYEAPVVHEWAVAGTFNGWNLTENQMTLVDDWYVVENIKMVANDQFKFCADGGWDVNRGAEGAADGVVIENNVETAVVQGGKNFAVSEGGFYSLYLNKAANKAKVVKTAELPVESVPDQPSDWALWAQSPDWKQIDMVTSTVPELFVAKGVALEAYKSFLVKPADDWSTKYGCGAVNYIQSNKYFKVSPNGGDITVEAAGTYDIYFDNINKNVYLMTSGTAYTSATQQTTSGVEPEPEPEPETGVTIYLKPGVWETGGARYQAWIWGAGDQWVTFTKVSNGLYSTKVPEGTTGMKVLRKGPEHANNAWQSWNDSGDVNLAGKNCIEITGWNQSYKMSNR